MQSWSTSKLCKKYSNRSKKLVCVKRVLSQIRAHPRSKTDLERLGETRKEYISFLVALESCRPSLMRQTSCTNSTLSLRDSTKSTATLAWMYVSNAISAKRQAVHAVAILPEKKAQVVASWLESHLGNVVYGVIQNSADTKGRLLSITMTSLSFHLLCSQVVG